MDGGAQGRIAVVGQMQARLATERGLLVSRIEQMEADKARLVAASVDSNADDEHDPEGQTIAFERSPSSLTRITEPCVMHPALSSSTFTTPFPITLSPSRIRQQSARPAIALKR